MAEATLNNHRLFEVFKVAGLIDGQVAFSTWKSQLQMLSRKYQVSPMYAVNQQLEAMDITFPAK